MSWLPSVKALVQNVGIGHAHECAEGRARDNRIQIALTCGDPAWVRLARRIIGGQETRISVIQRRANQKSFRMAGIHAPGLPPSHFPMTGSRRRLQPSGARSHEGRLAGLRSRLSPHLLAFDRKVDAVGYAESSTPPFGSPVICETITTPAAHVACRIKLCGRLRICSRRAGAAAMIELCHQAMEAAKAEISGCGGGKYSTPPGRKYSRFTSEV
jgi:hypothetical protein